MIDKIMSEASHSIIGMLSAKPLDMETRTANNEFSSLLVPGEALPGPVLDKDGADTAEDKRGEEFLAQLIGDDAKPVSVPNEQEAVKTVKAVAAKLSVESHEGDSELPFEAAPSPAPVSEMERFVSIMQPPSNGSANVGNDVVRLNKDSAPGQRARISNAAISNTDISDTAIIADVTVDQKVSAKAGIPKTSVVADSDATTLPLPKVSEDTTVTPPENKSPTMLKPAIEGSQPVASKPVLENSGKTEITHSATNSPVKQPLNIGMPKPALVETKSTDIMQNAAAITPPVSGSERNIRDSLDLRLASKGKVETSKRPQAAETEVRDAAIAADKPLKIETKLPFTEMEKLPAAGQLEKNIELSVPLHSAPVTGGQNTTAKAVSFDWNAPNFAQRFAAEISDLNISGDLKKFEINPRNLGRLEVSFISRGGAEVLQIDAESEAAREMIVQHSQAIQDMLKAQGRSDLTLRVDVKENMFAQSHNENMNFSEQDGTNEQEERSAPSSQNRGTGMSTEGDVDPPAPSDNSRYA